MIVIIYLLSGIPFSMLFTFLIRPFVPYLFLLLPKVFAQNTSLYLLISGFTGSVLGLVFHVPIAIGMGLISFVLFSIYFFRCIRGHNQFENVFGNDHSSHIKYTQNKNMLKKRWGFHIHTELPSNAKWERNVEFWEIPGREKPLLCDLWLPSENERSGLVFIYLHGSAWALGDKDFGTRPFFQHLVALGHTVMDIGYRLCPEVDIFGMVGDAHRAIAWIKKKSKVYGIDPNKIVLSGGSAGGHIALLAAYTTDDTRFIPAELKNTNISVCGAVSIYGTIDLKVGYEIYRVNKLSKKNPKVSIGTKINPMDFNKAGRYAGRPDIFLGGPPDEVPDIYEVVNPGNHVSSNTPPTFLVQGENDFLTPLSVTKNFIKILRNSSVPVIFITFPWTEHAFDLFFPKISPSAHSMWFDLDRFLAILADNVKE